MAWALWLTALALCLTVMAATWLIGRRIHNIGIVDPAWALLFSPVALHYSAQDIGTGPRKALITGMVLFWSVRLGAHLLMRVIRHHPEEDPRYKRLRTDWAPGAGWKIFLLFEAQGLLVAALSVPFLLACMNGAPRLGWTEWLGFAVWAAGLAGESLADRQLNRFKKDPANKGKVCEAGLWNFSRHPNYFFEWLVWVGYAILALPARNGWLALMSPILMYIFLTQITGVKPTEEQSLKSRGEAYRRYQHTTSAFFPWFKRSIA